jgi:hypothetical protein
MHTNVPGSPAVRAAFTALIDYAGLYPPAQLPMAESVAEYSAARSGSHSWMLGRFIVPASRVDELLTMVMGEPVALSVIVDAGVDSRTWLLNVQNSLTHIANMRRNETRIRVEALEIALPPVQTNRETYDAAIGQFSAAVQQASLRDVPAFVELPRDNRREALLPGAMYALARHRLGAKVRCGGVTSEATPSPAEIAQFIAHAKEDGVPYKATAGLHHPVRHLNAGAGFVMHGFLNVLVASLRAREGAGVDELDSIIASEDAAQLQLDASAEEIEAMRRETFIAYGSCSFSEPVEDLQSLGLI